jgi:flagellar biosynthesis regulator FlaF
VKLEILRLTKSLKITIIGLIIAAIGLSFWGVNVFLVIWSGVASRESALAIFIFAIIYSVGMLTLYYSDRIRQRERKNLDNK